MLYVNVAELVYVFVSNINMAWHEMKYNIRYHQMGSVVVA